jgi:hypothetical protein
VSSTDKVQEIAKPHRESLYLLGTEQVREWAKNVHLALLECRSKYVGLEFAASRIVFGNDISRLSLDFASTMETIKKKPL